MSERGRCSICGSSRPTRAAYWAKGERVCRPCWLAADREGLVPAAEGVAGTGSGLDRGGS